jgi:hypothetical protein
MRRAAAAALACLALAACTKHSAKPRIDGVQTFGGLGHTHVPWPVTYPQTPPVGGDHSDAWLNCGVYTEPVPNVNAVHSMEHGAVWLTYRPDLPQANVDTLHRLQGLKPAYVLISPYPGLPSPVVASAWGLQLTVDRPDDPRLAAFVRAYAGGGQGGEPGKPCSGGLDPAQARAYDAQRASATPSPGS